MGGGAIHQELFQLPQGGGAVRGIGETFTAEPQTGTGSMRLPLDLPRGRGGIRPDLTIGYSSGAGNGTFGIGWALSVPGIVRRTSHGVPTYDDGRDVFVLSGADELVCVELAPGRARYRPAIEGLFARIEHVTGAEDHWVVRARDGSRSWFGAGAGTLADPDHPSRVFAWHLTRTEDPFGNRIDYRYRLDEGVEAGERWTQLYLDEVAYLDVGPADARTPLIRVRFAYEDRPDPIRDRRARFAIATRRRCARAEVEIDGATNRTWHFEYGTDLDDVATGAGHSLLRRVRVVGHDGDRTQALPAIRLDYAALDPGSSRMHAVDGGPPSLEEPTLAVVDLDADGLPDIVELGVAPRWWRNQGGARFDGPYPFAGAPPVRLGDPGVQIVDADGDGSPDLLITRDGVAGYLPLHAGQAGAFVPLAAAPSLDLAAPSVRLADLDGDGVTDALAGPGPLTCFFAHPERGWTAGRRPAIRGRPRSTSPIRGSTWST